MELPVKGNYHVVNRSKDEVLAEYVILADSLWPRMKGLLGTSELAPGHGLILDPCNSIHTFFMAYAIDVIFVDKSHKIVEIMPAVKPWRLTRMIMKAHCVVELPAGSLEGTNAEVGDQLEWFKPNEGEATVRG